MNIKLMTHMIAGFPSAGKDLAVGEAMLEGGSDYLEIQFPFSDPSADGPVIQNACSIALAKGFRLEQGFELAAALAGKKRSPVFIMTYAALVARRGAAEFVAKAASCGAAGLIVPDLPPFEDEGLYEACANKGLACIPVIAPTISEERLQAILALKPEYIYTALRTGITGTKTEEKSTETRTFLGRLAGKNIKILAGFGIQEADQVRSLEGLVHAAIVGSALIRLTNEHADDETAVLAEAIKKRIRSLKPA